MIVDEKQLGPQGSGFQRVVLIGHFSKLFLQLLDAENR
jgi:hypothetical protein